MLPDIQPGNTKILYFFNCLLDGMHTNKAYFVTSERVFDIYSEVTKYALSVFIVYLFIFQLHKFNIDMYIQV